MSRHVLHCKFVDHNIHHQKYHQIEVHWLPYTHANRLEPNISLQTWARLSERDGREQHENISYMLDSTVQ